MTIYNPAKKTKTNLINELIHHLTDDAHDLTDLQIQNLQHFFNKVIFKKNITKHLIRSKFYKRSFYTMQIEVLPKHFKKAALIADLDDYNMSSKIYNLVLRKNETYKYNIGFFRQVQKNSLRAS